MRRIAVLGLGSFGYHLASTLSEHGAEVLAIDSEMRLVEQIKERVARALCLDATQKDNLRRASIHEMDVVIVTIGERSIEGSILATALSAQLGVPRVLARATTKLHAQILSLVGAHEVLNPEEDVAQRLAQRITEPAIHELIQISDDGYVLSELSVPASLAGQTLADANIRQKYGLNVVTIKGAAQSNAPSKINHQPGPADRLNDDDILVCIGAQHDVERFAQLDEA